VFTVKGHTVVDKVNPPAGYWALSDHDSDLSHNDNWKKDCKGNLLSPTPQPYYTAAKVESELISTSPMNRGLWVWILLLLPSGTGNTICQPVRF
jgi:hypothetical protein